MHNVYIMETKVRKMSLYFHSACKCMNIPPVDRFLFSCWWSLLTGEFLGDTAPDNPAYPRGP